MITNLWYSRNRQVWSEPFLIDNSILIWNITRRRFVACENSRPSSLPARVAFREKDSAIYRRKFHTDDVRVNFVILHKLSYAVFVNRNQIFFDPLLHTTQEKFVPNRKCLAFSHISIRDALATSDVQNILEIPATDEIHLEYRNQTCVSTVTFESCGARTTNGRINLYIKLEKHKLNQIAERNIRISLDKGIAF